MLSSVFNGTQKDELQCFNTGTTMILMRHAVFVVFAYNQRFYRFIGRIYKVARKSIDLHVLMSAYAIPGLPVRIYDCAPEDMDAPRPSIHPPIPNRREMLFCAGHYLSTTKRGQQILLWPSFFLRELVQSVLTDVSFDDVHPIPNPVTGNAPSRN